MRTAIFILACMLAACGGPPPQKKSERRPSVKPAAPKITQFYASQPAIARGAKTLLCYGVEDAVRVRLSPEVERLHPAMSRCIEVQPERTTTYTLTAEGEGGASASSTFTVTVSAAAARAETPRAQAPGPRIITFTKQKKSDLTLLCYEVEEAEAVSVEPGVLPRAGALQGCLGVAPSQPTTYTLTAYGRGGRTAQRTLQVSP